MSHPTSAEEFITLREKTAITQANIQPVAPQGLPAQVPAPLLRPGTQWQFTMRSGITGLVTDRATFRVASAAPEGYAIDEDWQKGPVPARYDSNLNPVRTRIAAYEPPYPRYEFPRASVRTGAQP